MTDPIRTALTEYLKVFPDAFECPAEPRCGVCVDCVVAAAIRARPIGEREVPDCHGCKHWTVYPPAKDYDKQYQHGQCRGMRACGVVIETTGDCSVDAITTDATFYCKGWEAR